MTLVVEHVNGNNDTLKWFGPFVRVVPQSTGDAVLGDGNTIVRDDPKASVFTRIVSFDPKVHVRTVTVTVELTVAEFEAAVLKSEEVSRTANWKGWEWYYKFLKAAQKVKDSQ